MSSCQHPIIGYYQAGKKWLPVTVTEEGKIVFEQDPNTALALTQMKTTVDTLAQYVHDNTIEMNLIINTDMSEALSSMESTINTAVNQMVNTIDRLLSDEEASDIVNTAWGS